MKKLIIISLLISTTFISANAQEWLTDMNEAKKIAIDENHNIVLVFQGSDWCAPCMKLEKEVWSTEEFQSYSKDHFVMIKADFPKRKSNRLDDLQQEKNNKLAEKYNKQGYFPLVVVLDKNGKVLGKSGYNKMNASEYIKLLNSY